MYMFHGDLQYMYIVALYSAVIFIVDQGIECSLADLR